MEQENDSKISQEAKMFVKKEKKFLIDKLANLERYPSTEKPFSFFMAGCPGAGKTEFSKRLMEIMEPIPIVRIDADEIRELIPQYNGQNSDLVHGAASIMVDNLNYYTLKHKQNSIMDGTFAIYAIARRNIVNCLKKNRSIGVFYIYQDPIIAWDFTRKREKLEGRHVPKEAFIEAFFKAKENVQRIKKEFGDRIKLNVVIKNEDNTIKKIEYNIGYNIDIHTKTTYNKESLNSTLC